MSQLSVTISQGFRNNFLGFLAAVADQTGDLSEDEFWGNPYPFGNSIGHLLLHVTGNLNSFIGAQLAESGYVRNRDLEFTDPQRRPKAAVLDELARAVDLVVATLDRQTADFVVIDSIQTMHSDLIDSAPGTVTQVRTSAQEIIRMAKSRNIAVLFVGHVTKDGQIAGPRVLEHLVDCVLYFEGDRGHQFRILRAVKNRFGATDEVGVFEMGSQGMSEVTNPSEVFLAERMPNAAGSAIAVTVEGTRPLLVEMQALSSTTSFSMPRRTANGIDFNRLLLLVAVLSKRVGLRLSDQDVFVNVVGGLTVEEPAADLPVAVAIASSYKNVPVAADVALMGEVGLSGELRTISHLSKRLSEAAKLGFKRAIVPRNSQRKLDGAPAAIEVIGVRTISEAIEAALIG